MAIIPGIFCRTAASAPLPASGHRSPTLRMLREVTLKGTESGRPVVLFQREKQPLGILLISHYTITGYQHYYCWISTYDLRENVLDSLAIQGDMIYLASLEHHARDPRLAVTNGDQWLWVKILKLNRRNITDCGI